MRGRQNQSCCGRISPVQPLPPERQRAIMLVLPALFAAIAFVLGHLQLLKLNLEAKTLTIFLAGQVGGRWCGAATGLLTCALHQLLNPFGMAPGLDIAAEAV